MIAAMPDPILPSDSDSKSQVLNLSWKDLTEFIDKQAEKNRAMMDYWFKLAVGIISVLFVLFAGGLTYFGFQTAKDAKAAAATAAAAEAENVMDQNPEIVLDRMAKDEKFKNDLLDKLAALAQKTVQRSPDGQGKRHPPRPLTHLSAP
jgi:hypothetical protein